MKLLFISVLYISVSYVLGAIDVSTYFELDGVPKNAYLFADNNCEKKYICKNREKHWYGHILYDCYYRSESVSYRFDPTERNDPDQCTFKGNVNLIAGKCYFTNNGDETTIDNFGGYPNARFYDIDYETMRALTEFGWCDYTPSINSDNSWMSNISKDTRINQINIPGTHDSGTYAVHYNSVPAQYEIRKHWAKTQDLDIYEQLLYGIRYLDIRLETNEHQQIYLNHEKFDCWNKKTHARYLLSDAFDETIEFLYNNPSETVIIHLKCDNCHIPKEDKDNNNYDFTDDDFYKAIANLSIANTSPKFNKKYNDFFYQDKEDFPTLEKAKGRIVLFTRKEFSYSLNDTTIYIGQRVDIPEMGECKKGIVAFKPICKCNRQWCW